MLDRRQFTLAAAGTLAALAVPARAAPRPVTVASLLAADKPETRVWEFVRDRVEENLPGRFAFRIVPNAALGGEREVAEGMRLGSVQGSLSTLSALSAWVPELQLFDLPFLFDGREHLQRAMASEIGIALREDLAAQGFVAPAFVNYGARQLLTKTPVRRPEEVRGLRIRVIQSPLHTELWSAYGANPVAIAIPETYNALSTGVVDAMDLTKSAYAGFRLYEVVPYLTETAHIWAAGIIHFSAGFWDTLGEEEKAVLAEAAAAGAAEFDRMIIEDEARSMEEAAAAGGEIVQPEDLAGWRRGAEAAWDVMADAVGGRERIDAVRAL